MKGRDSGTAYLLWAAGWLGPCGLHRFYTDKPWSGLAYLLTFGFCGIGQFIDLFMIPGQVAAANARVALVSRAPIPELPPARRVSKKDAMRINLCKAAVDKGGILTVTEGVLATGANHDEVEKVLDEMARRGWVDIGNHPESGVVIYRFTDLA